MHGKICILYDLQRICQREKNLVTNTIAFLRKRTCFSGQYNSSDLSVRMLGWDLN